MLLLAEPDLDSSYGVNILSELDDEGEYFISEEELLLYFKPPAGSEPSEWVGATAPVLSVNASAVITLNNVSHVQLKDLTVAYGRANGVAMSGKIPYFTDIQNGGISLWQTEFFHADIF